MTMKTNNTPQTPLLTRRQTIHLATAVGAGAILGTTFFRTAATQESLRTGSSTTSYARSEALVDAAWLAEHRDDAGMVLVNVLLPDAADVAYIPGSVGIVIPELGVVDTSDASIEQWNQTIQARLGDLGVTPSSTVVAYDNDTLFSARLWWILHYLGHEDVHVLDGGVSAWQAAGYEVASEAVPAVAVEPYAGVPNGALLAQMDEVLAAIDAADNVILDARVLEEYAEGHIPGAVNLNFPLNAAPEPPKVYKSAEELTAMYAEIGVSPDRRIIPYCATGVRSAVTAFVLHLLGYEEVALYTGSWAEWGEDPDAPKTVGAAP
jgi:thiosulfate/3-mercaptopyruvate sulfurtransferase